MISAIVFSIVFALLFVICQKNLTNRYLALFAGILLFPLGIFFSQSPTLRPMDLFLYGYFAIFLIFSPGQLYQDIKALPLKIPLLLILLFHFASVYVNEGTNPKQFYACTREFMELYGFIFAAFIAGRHCGLNSIVKKFFVGTAVLCILSILEILLQGNYPYTYICRAFPIYSGYYSLEEAVTIIRDWRVQTMATTAHPTAWGTFLSCAIVLFANLWDRKVWIRKNVVIILALIVISLILCGSRTAIVCSAIGVGLTFLRKKHILFKIGFIGTLLFLGIVYINVLIGQVSQQGHGSSLSLRQQQLIFTLVQIERSPIFGNGVGFTKNVFEYDDDGRPINDADIGGLESIIFRTLIDYGFLGLFAYYLYNLSLFILFFRRRNESWAALVGCYMVFVSTIFVTLSGHIGNNAVFAYLAEGLLLGNLYKENEEPDEIDYSIDDELPAKSEEDSTES